MTLSRPCDLLTASSYFIMSSSAPDDDWGWMLGNDTVNMKLRHPHAWTSISKMIENKEIDGSLT